MTQEFLPPDDPQEAVSKPPRAQVKVQVDHYGIEADLEPRLAEEGEFRNWSEVRTAVMNSIRKVIVELVRSPAFFLSLPRRLTEGSLGKKKPLGKTVEQNVQYSHQLTDVRLNRKAELIAEQDWSEEQNAKQELIQFVDEMRAKGKYVKFTVHDDGKIDVVILGPRSNNLLDRLNEQRDIDEEE
ncbi:hypothetical protein [Calycomorphotria hydatis]|uniref:Uncharacterized protein n=1 Tax=Calycomorphotria hydatis TaxID=2528027 RepID=A0A517T5T0_9PLAN|nr:hypothetical protein [Calycomorphotria hydatis]QDT63723.1 hypothetical protein V22_09480 [Calycomorphotria hydatis]